MQNGIATLENSFIVSYAVKYIFTIWIRNPAPKYLPKLDENLKSERNRLLIRLVSLFVWTLEWKNLKCIVLSEENTPSTTYYTIPFI